MFLNLINIDFIDLLFFKCPVPIISLILSKIPGEVKQRTNYTLTSILIKNESMIINDNPFFVELVFVFIFVTITK